MQATHVEPVNTRLIQRNRQMAREIEHLTQDNDQLRAQVRYYQRRSSERYAKTIRRGKLMDETLGYVIAAAIIVTVMLAVVFAMWNISLWLMEVIL